MCVGNHFAMMEAEIALNKIIAAFRFQALGPVPPPAIPSITLRPTGAVPVGITKR